MSFNNHLGFNVPKAIPTTSTTNTNTGSMNSSSPSNTASDHKNDNKGSGYPLLKNSTQSSNYTGAPATAVTSEVTPATAHSDSSTSKGHEKPDLIGLFDKFDIDQNKKSGDEDDIEDIDSIEEKMSQFHGPSSHSEYDTITTVDEESKKESEVPASTQSPKTSITPETSQKKESLPSEPIDNERQSETLNNDMASSMGIQPYILPEESSTADPSQGEYTRDDLLEALNNEAVEEYQLKENEIPEDSVVFPDTQQKGTTEPSAVNYEHPPTRPRQKRNNSLIKRCENINPREQYQLSHRPFDFQTFLNHLRKKSADPIVRYIRSFLVSFVRQSGNMNMTQLISAIRNFKQFIKTKFELYEPFASMDSNDLENSNEGIEKLIMNRLYEYCFSPEIIKKNGTNASESILQDVYDDNDFLIQSNKFSWISGKHLDIDVDEISQRKKQNSKENTNYLQKAQTELNKMSTYRAPRDKIICLLNACKIIFSLLRVSKKETNADAFIPLLILIIIRAKTEYIISNLRYIERFRGEEWLNHGETSYYLSSLQGAITFIQNLTKEDLTVTEEEFDANMEAWSASQRQNPLQLLQPKPIKNTSDTSQTGTRQNLSASNVLMASAELFSKSFSNFISSPSPEQSLENQQNSSNNTAPDSSEPTSKQIETVFTQLSEVFPNLDKSILKDVIIMNKADMDSSLDACLQLVSEN